MKKQSGFIVIALAIVAVISFAAEAEASFSDVAEGYWAMEEVEYLEKSGVMNGYENGEFGVNDEVTRAQAAAVLVRTQDLDTSDPEDVSFDDVSVGDDSYADIAAVVEAGYFSDRESFHPGQSLTRAQLAEILTEAYALEGDESVDYRDVPEDYWAYEAIGTLGENQITTGDEDLNYRPSEEVTRAQFSVFVARAEDDSFQEDYAVLSQKMDLEAESEQVENIFYPRITGLDESTQEEINRKFEDYAQEASEAEELERVQEAVQNAPAADELGPDHPVSDPPKGHYSYSNYYQVERKHENHLSIVFDESYIASVNGGTATWKAFNFDPETGETLELSDLFEDNADYVSIIENNTQNDEIDTVTDNFYANDEEVSAFFNGTSPTVISTPWEEFEE